MKDKTPGLFDFDDEELFPKTDTPAAIDGKEEKTKEADVNDVLERDIEEEQNRPLVLLAGIKVAFEVPPNNGPTEVNKSKVEETKLREKGVITKNKAEAFWKPNLELPTSEPEEKEPAIVKRGEENQTRESQIIYFDKPASPVIVLESEQHFKEVNGSEKTLQSPVEEGAAAIESQTTEIPLMEDLSETAVEKMQETKELPEWQLDKKYYTIGDVAKLFEANVSLIRFWATEFKIKTRTTRKGDRLFSPAQIAELRLIYHLVKVNKYTLKGAKEVLKSGSLQLENHLDLREELQKLYDTLVAIRTAL